MITGDYGATPGVSTHDPYAGSYAAEFYWGHTTSFYQDITTVGGATYTVGFYLATWDADYGFSSGLTQVEWNGDTLDVIGTGSIMPYQLYSYTLTATTDSTRLQFWGDNAIGYTEIDNVSVTADTTVPEPLSCGMSAAGIALCALLRRARRRRDGRRPIPGANATV